jgi:hypothetical protein
MLGLVDGFVYWKTCSICDCKGCVVVTREGDSVYIGMGGV